MQNIGRAEGGVTTDAVAEHAGLFDGVIASDGVNNLKGQAKADALVERYGKGGFDYAGNAKADLIIWKAAGEAILVNPLPGVRKAAAIPRRAARRRFWQAG